MRRGFESNTATRTLDADNNIGCTCARRLGMALGFFAGWTRDVNNTHVAELNAVVRDLAIPGAIFSVVAQASREILAAQLPLAIILSGSMLVFYGATYLMARYVYKEAPAEAAVQACMTSLPNYAAAGMPLIAALPDGKNVVATAVSIACASIVVSPLTLVILEARQIAFSRIHHAGRIMENRPGSYVMARHPRKITQD
jgi:predicted permease